MTGKRRRGFTLIELLVVIAVIGILAAITLSAAFLIQRRTRVRLARGSAGRLQQAVDAYQVQMNFLPVHKLYSPETDADGDYENYELVAQLNGIMSRDKLLKLERSETNSSGSFKDPWGRPFRVVMWKKRPGDKHYHFYQVYSCGENAVWEMGGGDDLTPSL
jgi:prepilin-type N-terminal cleavage/methylation domain-containing protein